MQLQTWAEVPGSGSIKLDPDLVKHAVVDSNRQAQTKPGSALNIKEHECEHGFRTSMVANVWLLTILATRNVPLAAT